MLYIILIFFYTSLVSGRAPLVSLTVSVNNTSLVTFDKSSYTYPLPSTSLSSLGFSGPLYIPTQYPCCQSLLPEYSSNMTHDGIVLLPFRYCRNEWDHILHVESLAGRASGCLLYSMKTDAAQAAELISTQSSRRGYRGTSVWVVNSVVGEYLLRHLPSSSSSNNNNNLEVSIRRTERDVSEDDKNFFLKAMVGVGITGIVCFFIALGVRYFNCLRPRPRPRRAAAAVVSLERSNNKSRRVVLRREELDRMQCRVIEPPPRAYQKGNRSCPQLATKPTDGLRRSWSLQATATAKGGWEANKCAICLEDVGVGDVVRELVCGHEFHRGCIDRWLLTQSCMCPLCKRSTLI